MATSTWLFLLVVLAKIDDTNALLYRNE